MDAEAARAVTDGRTDGQTDRQTDTHTHTHKTTTSNPRAGAPRVKNLYTHIRQQYRDYVTGVKREFRKSANL